MFPSRTVMDLVRMQSWSYEIETSNFTSVLKSLALALYFASRGIGVIRDGTDLNTESIGSGIHSREYACTARVLLSGLGSDELLGGYSRHKLAFTNGGWPALLDEVIIRPQLSMAFSHGCAFELSFSSILIAYHVEISGGMIVLFHRMQRKHATRTWTCRFWIS